VQKSIFASASSIIPVHKSAKKKKDEKHCVFIMVRAHSSAFGGNVALAKFSKILLSQWRRESGHYP